MLGGGQSFLDPASSSAAIAFISGSASISFSEDISPRSRTTSRAAVATGSSSANSFDAATKSAGAISPVAMRACSAAWRSMIASICLSETFAIRARGRPPQPAFARSLSPRTLT
jgi:hypothetical protein